MPITQPFEIKLFLNIQPTCDSTLVKNSDSFRQSKSNLIFAIKALGNLLLLWLTAVVRKK